MVAYYSSPIGLIKVAATNDAISSVMFVEKEDNSDITVNPLLMQASKQLDEYFIGKRKTFDLPLQQRGTTFQESVWNELRKIPFGHTVSYMDIARELGKEEFVRAVGAANGQNKIAIMIPCHRVIGSNGKLVGFAYGIERKKFLLDHEKEYYQLGLHI